MRCAADVDRSVLYGLSPDGTLYQLDLRKVEFSKSGNCSWKVIAEKAFSNKLKFSTCEGMLYNHRKKHLYVFSTCLVDHSDPHLFLSIFDCNKKECGKYQKIKIEGAGNWIPDVYCFDEHHQRLFVGGPSNENNETLFLSIDVDNLSTTQLPSIRGILSKGTLLAHPETNRLFYVGGQFDDKDCLPASKQEVKRTFTYHELNLQRESWKRFRVNLESAEDGMEDLLAPLCSFPKPYNFIRIHACEFPSGKRFQGQTIDFSIEGKDDGVRRATVKTNFRAGAGWYEPWNPLKFKKRRVIPISFCGVFTGRCSSLHRDDGSQTPLRDESFNGNSTRTHVLMPVKSMARWWYTCQEIGVREDSCLCVICKSNKV
jgi:hypothetical protein